MPILYWLDRAKHAKAAEAVPYRLLQAEKAHSAGDPETPNMLIQGDNLEALKALLPYYAGRVKCIYIDALFLMTVIRSENGACLNRLRGRLRPPHEAT
jgi:hypothetical protein